MSLSGVAMNLALVYGLMQAATFFELDKPENTIALRVIYGSSQLIGFIILLVIRSKIHSNQDKTQLSYVEQKSPFDSSQSETVVTTNSEYDLSQLKQQFTQFFLALGLISFLHFRSGFVRPLILQSVLSFKNLWATPLFQVYLLGKPCDGALKRPWKQNPFGTPVQEVTEKQLKAKEKKKKQ